MRVLLIDDQPDILEWLKAALSYTADDIEVRARGGIDELTEEDAFWAETALVDWMMPKMDGLGVIEWLISKNPAIRPFLLTAAGGGATRDLEWPVIRKPIDAVELVEMIRP